MAVRRIAIFSLVVAAACGSATDPIEPAPDAMPDASPDALPDSMQPDGPPEGFGAVSGACGVLDDEEWNAATPFWFEGTFDFGDDRYDDPADRDRLTPGGQIIVATDNAGGSSVYSEVFAFEWLARCEGAGLLKTETEIDYDASGKTVDLLVTIDGRKVGVSVTRAMTFPLGNPYTLQAATELFERKLENIQVATTLVSAGDAWERQMLSVLAYDPQHAQVAMEAWSSLPAEVRDDTILVVSVTAGDDTFIYTDN